jgi:hypothetical protein
MGHGQDAPDFGTQPQRVGKDLENNVAIPGPVAVSAQRRQAKGVRRVVRQVESAIGGNRMSARIQQPNPSGPYQRFGFGGVGGLGDEGLPLPCQVLKRRVQRRLR